MTDPTPNPGTPSSENIPFWTQTNRSVAMEIVSLLADGNILYAIAKYRDTHGIPLVKAVDAVYSLKGIMEPKTFCPFCDSRLPVLTARQCFSCSADWHSRGNLSIVGNPQPNAETEVNVARVVAEASAKSASAPAGLPPDREVAWQEWSRTIQNVDEQGMKLLREAFEVAFEAGTQAGQK